MTVEELLNHLFIQNVKKTHAIPWNYQEAGKLHIDNYIPKDGPYNSPLPWNKKLRIAKHPNKEIYAYASSRCDGIINDETSCICIYSKGAPYMDKTIHRITNYPKHGYDIKPAFSPDGKWIAFISIRKYGMINNVGDVLIAPYNSNGKDVVNLTEKLTISGMCKEFQWSSNNSNTLLLEYCKKGDSKVCSISFDPNNPFSTDINELGNFKLDPRVERGDYKYTQDFVSSTLNNQDYSFLNIGSVDRFEYSTSDEITSYYWFAHPNPEKNNHRTLLLCQGGPHHAWEPEVECGTYHIPLLQHLGYTIIMPIVRGMPGISQEFDDQVRGDWGGQCIKDYLAALDVAIKEHELDENNVAVLGHSFGGFCAYSMNIQHPDRFRCVVSESGPFDLDSFLTDSKKPGPIEGSIKNQTMKCEMYNGLANPEGKIVAEKMIREQSPHNLIKNRKDQCKPILIIHGKEDSRVPFDQAESAQKAFGVKPFIFEDEGHSFVKPENKRDRYLRIFDFLDMYMD